MQTIGVAIYLVFLFATVTVVGQSVPLSVTNADEQVEQGLTILGKNEFGISYAHGLRPFKFEVPTYGSEIERFQIAVTKFQTALLYQERLVSYEPVDVHGFLAVGYCRLANSIKSSSLSGQMGGLDRRIAYGACFAEFERVIKGKQTQLTSIRASSYIKSIIESGDYGLALAKIAELRKLARSSRRFSTTDLSYFEGDAYFHLGDRKRAGLAYDLWLRSMSGDFVPSQEIVARLTELNKDVGLPTSAAIARLNSLR
jgi:hypothetical protein